MKIRYISTPIYYANDKPHVGHLYSTLIADVMKKASVITKDELFFLSGLDEHGQKVAQAAQLKGYSPKDYVDFLSQEFIDFFASFDVFPDHWIRTTDKEHEVAVKAFWEKLQENGYIYKSNYAGWYSISDEAYLNDASKEEYVESKNPNIVWREEECYYFKLSAFQEKLENFYKENPDFIYPKKRYNEAIGFLNKNLKDFAISRPKDRLFWGIEVPGDENHVIYVWIDALVNYISAIGYPDEKYKQAWPGMHILGKDILKFHAIYWPALLMGAGVELPKQLIVHGWWLKDDAKISKSLGNAGTLTDIVKRYQSDGLRYYLLRGIEIGEDGQFREELVKQVVNGELANKFGNIFLRILGIVELAFDNELPATVWVDNDINKGAAFAEPNIVAKLNDVYAKLEAIIDKPYLIKDYLDSFITCTETINNYFESEKIWTYEDRQKKSAILYFLLDIFKKLALLIYPIMPGISNKILDFFNLPPTLDSYNVNLRKEFGISRPVLFPKYSEPTAEGPKTVDI